MRMVSFWNPWKFLGNSECNRCCPNPFISRILRKWKPSSNEDWRRAPLDDYSQCHQRYSPPRIYLRQTWECHSFHQPSTWSVQCSGNWTIWRLGHRVIPSATGKPSPLSSFVVSDAAFR